MASAMSCRLVPLNPRSVEEAGGDLEQALLHELPARAALGIAVRGALRLRHEVPHRRTLDKRPERREHDGVRRCRRIIYCLVTPGQGDGGMRYAVGVDVGGTFTDAVLDDESGSVVAAKAPSTPPDYSRGVLDVLELLAEQLGRPVEEMLADTHHIAHGTTSSLNALVTGKVPDVGFLTTQGPPRLDLHHERRGPLPRALAARAPARARAGQGPRPAAEAPRPRGHRADRPRRQRRRRARRGRGARGGSARCWPTACGRSRSPCCGRSATRPTSSASASSSTRSTRTCTSRSPARSARASASSRATRRPS